MRRIAGIMLLATSMLAAPAAAQASTCRDPLAQTLAAAGFRGADLREAWAIVKRESGGRPGAISPTHDYGLFQLNRATWSRQAWWKPAQLLTATYNAAVAYRLSDGGRTWRAWDLSGKGKWLGRYSTQHDYQRFLKFFNAYPCTQDRQGSTK